MGHHLVVIRVVHAAATLVFTPVFEAESFTQCHDLMILMPYHTVSLHGSLAGQPQYYTYRKKT